MRLSCDKDVPIEAIPWTGPTKYLVKCKVKSSPKCHKWHFNNEIACKACKPIRGIKPKNRGPFPLTEKQLGVLCLHCSGATNDEVAVALDIAEKSVNFTLKQIKEKFGIDNPKFLIHYALKYNLIRNFFDE